MGAAISVFRYAEHDLDYYIQNRLIFDTAGFAGDVRSVKSALVELPSKQVVFATDYPQEIRERSKVKAFVDGLRELENGDTILDKNTGLLIPGV